MVVNTQSNKHVSVMVFLVLLNTRSKEAWPGLPCSLLASVIYTFAMHYLTTKGVWEYPHNERFVRGVQGYWRDCVDLSFDRSDCRLFERIHLKRNTTTIVQQNTDSCQLDCRGNRFHT